MKIVTAANHRMSRFASQCARSIEKSGYSPIVYDLGDLGFGKPFTIDNKSFQEQGYYHQLGPQRFAPGQHKLALLRHCLEEFKGEFIVYLDADTLLNGRIDEMAGDYDVGLTVRSPEEVSRLLQKKSPPAQAFIYDGYINTGVMCFNPGPGCQRFFELWEEWMAKVDDEQCAINNMLEQFFPLKSGQILELDGIRIRLFDTQTYNHYYFNPSDEQWKKAKILHFKGKMRHEYERILKNFQPPH